MQGQKSAFGPLPEVIAFDHGSTSSDAGFDQQMGWTSVENSSQTRVPDFLLSSSDTNRGHLNAASHPGHDFYRWDFPGSSSRSAQVEIGQNDQNTEHEWPPAPMRVSAGSMIISDQQYQSSNREDANQTLLGRNSGSYQPPHQHDLNVNYEMDDDDNNDHDDDCQVLEYPHVLNSGGPRIEQPPFASSSSNPFGAPRYLVDEIDGRPGYSLDGQRLSCKRKSPEGNLGQPSDGGSTSSTHPTQTSLNFTTPEQVNPRLGLSFGQVASDSFPSLYASGAPSSSRRNFRLRINAAHQQGSVSNTMFTPDTNTGNTINQSSRLLPPSNLLDLRSASTTSNVRAESQPVPPVRVPSLRPVSQSRWNGAPSLSSVASGARNAAQHEGSTSTSMPRSIADYHIAVPPSEPRSSLQSVPPIWGLPGVNVDVSGDVASASRTSTGSGSWVPHQSPSQNPHRLAEYFRRSLVADTVSGGQNSDHLHSAASSSQEIPPPSGSSSQGRHSYSRSAMLVERRSNSAFGIPYSLRNMNLAVAGEGRSRLVSEMRNVLDLVRRGEGLRFEDVMMLDQSGFFGVADRYDRHRDMRLDVDNMSYEELLALEEHIGNVNTGLSEECILKQLKQHNYISNESEEEKIEPCCVCQEEYNNGEVVGLLECGHDFHAECIKKWLMLKNLCPICKTTGLNNK